LLQSRFTMAETTEMVAVTSSPRSAALTGTIGKNPTHINTEAVTNNHTRMNTDNPNSGGQT
jgi:hypothetical protein